MNMIPILGAFKNFALKFEMEARNEYIVCKLCGGRVETAAYYSESHNAGKVEIDSGTYFSCYCGNPKLSGSSQLEESEMAVIAFNDAEEARAWFARVDIRSRASEYRVMKKRAGKHERSCHVCNKSVQTGNMVHARTVSGCSFRGRHWSETTYVCPECFNGIIGKSIKIELQEVIA